MVLWIVGLATMADTVGSKNMGRATGITSAAVSAGSLAGPMMAGILVKTVGYWQAWSLSILVVGFHWDWVQIYTYCNATARGRSCYATYHD